MADKETVKALMELENDITDLQRDEPYRYPDEEVDGKEVDECRPIELDRAAKPWEILEAVGTTRTELSMALAKVHSLIEALSDEIDKLKAHRHDASKEYTGRPEM